ncbi:NTP transferase domain-containing protein [[Clostridium] symbiosum]|uniref:phosphocholine cytidylyltransferase family protein n=1 Tax=Clostridium symbiosum TaxID=1512 RepID=UPI002F4230E4
MKVLILNSGMGSRMGVLTSEHPKCMTEISNKDTILSRQLKMIAESGLTEVVITTGLFDSVLVNYCQSLELPLTYTFVKNELYKETNYIYSIYCAREYLDDDILLMHGDLVFESAVLDSVVNHEESCMAVSSTLPLPEKDFKAVIHNGYISKIGIEFLMKQLQHNRCIKLKSMTGKYGCLISWRSVRVIVWNAMRKMHLMRCRKGA